VIVTAAAAIVGCADHGPFPAGSDSRESIYLMKASYSKFDFDPVAGCRPQGPNKFSYELAVLNFGDDGASIDGMIDAVNLDYLWIN